MRVRLGPRAAPPAGVAAATDRPRTRTPKASMLTQGSIRTPHMLWSPPSRHDDNETGVETMSNGNGLRHVTTQQNNHYRTQP